MILYSMENYVQQQLELTIIHKSFPHKYLIDNKVAIHIIHKYMLQPRKEQGNDIHLLVTLAFNPKHDKSVT